MKLATYHDYFAKTKMSEDFILAAATEYLIHRERNVLESQHITNLYMTLRLLLWV